MAMPMVEYAVEGAECTLQASRGLGVSTAVWMCVHGFVGPEWWQLYESRDREGLIHAPTAEAISVTH